MQLSKAKPSTEGCSMDDGDVATMAAWRSVLEAVQDGKYNPALFTGVDIDWPDIGSTDVMPILGFQMAWAPVSSGDSVLWLRPSDIHHDLNLSKDARDSLKKAAILVGRELNGRTQRFFLTVNIYGVWISPTRRNSMIRLAPQQRELSAALLAAVSPAVSAL